jgi:iron complex outermembrane receptor protein
MTYLKARSIHTRDNNSNSIKSFQTSPSINPIKLSQILGYLSRSFTPAEVSLSEPARNMKMRFGYASTVALLTGMGLAAPQMAHAQDAAAAAAPDGAADEIVVTGSRIVRNGYEAPTPVTVIGDVQLQQQATSNAFEFINTLPAFAGSFTPSTSSQNVSSGQAGISGLNLRDLGTNRTLVLVNGQRSVGSSVTGVVDINTIPQQLIKRIDLVTGGASAAYGSDAVGGVVNFVLDTEYTGLKGEVSGGGTTYGDGGNAKLSLTGGTSFADGRGHVIVSGEFDDNAGIVIADRKWNERGIQIVNNPNYVAGNGQPQRLLLSQVSSDTGLPGGIIVSGPLKGTFFGPGGTPGQLNYGSLSSSSFFQGGDWQTAFAHTDGGQSLEPAQTTKNLFARVSYDVTDNINVYFQSNWNHSDDFSHAYRNEYYGGITVAANNPFLPASIAAQAKALGLTSLSMGSTNADLGVVSIQNTRTVWRNVVGANGNFSVLDTDWGWDAYYQNGLSMNSESAFNDVNLKNYNNALAAVVNPKTGAIVCASTLTNPGNGCVPFNPFGTGVNSPAARAYATGISHLNQDYEQNVWAASIHGNPFSNWAGPISVSAGIEHRDESASGQSTADDLAANFYAGDYIPTTGSFDVTEGFFETVVPLAKDLSWAKSMDFNGAVRMTSYSASGKVTTWKVGGTYAPIDDISFRVTRSQDIRAPNLSDLYAGGTVMTNNVVNDKTGQSVPSTQITSGNPGLLPEIAQEEGIGVVFKPTFMPGFNASIDYWNIDISGAINSISAQQVEDLCFQGNSAFCSAINGGAGLVDGGNVSSNVIKIEPFNLARQIVRGIDFEASYQTPMSVFNADWGGDLIIRGLATHYLRDYQDNSLAPPTNTVGANISGTNGGPPKWRWNVTASYINDPLNVTFAARGVSAGTYGNNLIECSISCPVSTVNNPTINSVNIAGAVYFDASISYKFDLGESGSRMEVFFNVKNLFDRDPAIVAGGPSGLPFDTVTSNAALYDVDGRIFRAGLRFEL